MFLYEEVFENISQDKPKTLYSQDDSDFLASEWVIEHIKKNNWLILVDESYINDNFNLYGLNNIIEKYNSVLKYLKGQYFDFFSDMTQSQMNKEAEKLYSLIHSRFLLTYSGVKKTRKKFEQGHYGKCPRELTVLL